MLTAADVAQCDSLRRRVVQARALLGETRGRAAEAERALAAYSAALPEAASLRRVRAAVADTERARAAAEDELVTAVERELAARRVALVATLRRDIEAAEFAAASVAFLAATSNDVARPAQVVRPRRPAAAPTPPER